MLIPIQNSLHTSHIVLSSWSWRTPCALFVLNALPSVLGTPCTTWGLGMKTKQHPHKLSSTTATFRNQIFQVSRRTWSHNAAPDSSAFSPVTRHKNYYALSYRTDSYKGADSTKEGPTVYVGFPYTCLDSHFPFLAVLGCAKKSLTLLLGQTSYCGRSLL